MTARSVAGMKVLLATDGSQDARCAELLVKSVRWPKSTRITLLHVDAPWAGDSELPPDDLEALHNEARAEIKLHLDGLRREIAKAHPGVKIDEAITPGRPGTAIVEQARETKADLVVLGSRGHGAIASALIGSVAAEVVDHSPAPVLVARTAGIAGVVVSDDGSDGARQAEEVIARWSFLRGLPIRVVSVVDSSPAKTGFASGVVPAYEAAWREMVREKRHEHETYAADGAARIAGLGKQVTSEARSGFVAREIIASATESGADLIVVGSRGRSGVARVLLGSVARSVLFNAKASVLIVRQKVDVPPAR